MNKLATLMLTLSSLFAASCGPDQRIINSSREREAAEGINANVAPAVSSLEKDIQSMRTADFKFILVFRRKDKKELDSADKEAIVRFANQANRRTLSDGGKAVVIGSNFPFAAADHKELSGRFEIENLSGPETGSMISNASPGPGATPEGANERRER